MNDQSYRDLFSKISPSEQLIDQTKEKMRERAVLNRTCRYSFGRQKRFFPELLLLWLLLAAFLLSASTLLLLLQPASKTFPF